MLSIVLAVFASMGNATASVLQRKATITQDEDASALQLILGLVRTPAWVGGIGAMAVGFLLQAAALATGPISVVQPILIVELSFTLLLAAAVFHRRLHRREWGAVAGMSIGLAVLLEALRPSGGDAYGAPLGLWLLSTAITLGIVVVLIVAGFRATVPAAPRTSGWPPGWGSGSPPRCSRRWGRHTKTRGSPGWRPPGRPMCSSGSARGSCSCSRRPCRPAAWWPPSPR